jgi:phosphatidylserine decarboxylase
MSLKTISFSFHPAGRVFIAAFAAVTVLLGLSFGSGAFWFGAALTGWCAYFFRDPPRVTPVRPGLIVSPADGVIVAISEQEPEEDLGLGHDTRTRVSIFLNIFDVHVNRMPADGIVKSRVYRTGKFLNASLDKASEDNERLALALQLTGEHPYKDKLIGVVQIAGLIARRIVCLAQEGGSFKAGERYGIIRFGSRADVYLPQGLQPLVIVGQRVLGGETVLADAASNEAARRGDIR